MTKAADARPSRSATAGRLLTGYPMVVVLLCVFWVLAVTSTLHKCTTADENVHLTAGYSYWAFNDYRLNPENGNLPGRWAALPLLLGDDRFPSRDHVFWWKSMQWVLGYEFLYRQGNDPEGMLLRGRAMIALLGVALGLLVYLWSRRLFGRVGGLISLALYAFSPTILAHSRLITSDFAAALFFSLSLAALWLLLHRLTCWTLAGSCLAMAGLFISKMSAVLVIPMALALIAIRLISSKPLVIALRRRREVNRRITRAAIFAGVVLAHAAVVVLVIWASCGFRYSPFASGETGRDELAGGSGWADGLKEAGVVGRAIAAAKDHRLLPEAYLFGFANVHKATQGRGAFLNGSYRLRGWWWFFPYAFLVKTPLGIFVVVALAALAAVTHWRSQKKAGRDRRRPVWEALYRTAPLWVLLAAYWAVSVRTELNIGHRHVLPTYPPMFVLAGAAAWWFRARRRAWGALVAAAALTVVAESLWIWPHYLAYFSPLAGGPANGYRHLVDSSLDWGQDLPGLKRYLDGHGLSDQKHTRVYLSYFGNGSAAYYRVQARRLFGFPNRERTHVLAPMRGGVYCVSATMVQTVLTRAGGPWTKWHEANYQNLRSRFQQLLALSEASPDWPGVPAGEDLDEDVELLDALQVGRLCSHLRLREPDDHVGYSILIYRLTDEDIRRALLGPPGELREDDFSPPPR